MLKHADVRKIVLAGIMWSQARFPPPALCFPPSLFPHAVHFPSKASHVHAPVSPDYHPLWPEVAPHLDPARVRCGALLGLCAAGNPHFPASRRLDGTDHRQPAAAQARVTRPDLLRSYAPCPASGVVSCVADVPAHPSAPSAAQAALPYHL